MHDADDEEEEEEGTGGGQKLTLSSSDHDEPDVDVSTALAIQQLGEDNEPMSSISSLEQGDDDWTGYLFHKPGDDSNATDYATYDANTNPDVD